MGTTSTSKARATRDRLLDAAERVVVEHGALSLTLEAVAAEAGVSKGGLLYHFPSKDQLAAALVGREVALVDAALERAAADGTPGSFTRAYLRLTMGDGTAGESGADPLSTALLGAAALDPALLDPLREAYARWQARLEEDGLPVGDATLVRLAVDGWWTGLVLGLPSLSPACLDEVRSRLDQLCLAPEAARRT
jgi:AcrR family transcriptional regulator